MEVISHGKSVCARCSIKGLSICNLSAGWLMDVVDGEKLRAMLLINPTKSTLLPILNRGEVGQKPKADLLYLVQQATNTSSIFSNQTSSQSLSPKLSEPNSIKTLILLLLES